MNGEQSTRQQLGTVVEGAFNLLQVIDDDGTAC